MDSTNVFLRSHGHTTGKKKTNSIQTNNLNCCEQNYALSQQKKRELKIHRFWIQSSSKTVNSNIEHSEQNTQEKTNDKHVILTIILWGYICFLYSHLHLLVSIDLYTWFSLLVFTIVFIHTKQVYDLLHSTFDSYPWPVPPMEILSHLHVDEPIGSCTREQNMRKYHSMTDLHFDVLCRILHGNSK